MPKLFTRKIKLKKKLKKTNKRKKYGSGKSESDAAKGMLSLKRGLDNDEINATESLLKYRKMQRPQQKEVNKAIAVLQRANTKNQNIEFNEQRDREIQRFGLPNFKVGDTVGFTRLPDRGKTGEIKDKRKNGISTIYKVHIANLGLFEYDAPLLRPVDYPEHEKKN